MNNEEALRKIEEISGVIQASNKAFFSGQHMIAYGVMVLMIPLLGFLTRWFTFGYDFGSMKGLYIAATHIVFYWGLSVAISKMWLKKEKAEPHPLIKQAFSATKPIVLAIFAAVFGFALLGMPQFIYPVVYLLLGVMFSLYGRFTIPFVSYVAWSYIVLGFIFLLLTQRGIPYLDFYFLAYNGITYVLMGILLEKAEAAPDAQRA